MSGLPKRGSPLHESNYLNIPRLGCTTIASCSVRSTQAGSKLAAQRHGEAQVATQPVEGRLMDILSEDISGTPRADSGMEAQ
jgi:hypothetical protein